MLTLLPLAKFLKKIAMPANAKVVGKYVEGSNAQKSLQNISKRKARFGLNPIIKFLSCLLNVLRLPFRAELVTHTVKTGLPFLDECLLETAYLAVK